MKIKIIFLLFILGGIYSCRKDKFDVMYPPKDYRDSVVGPYSGMEIVNSWDISHNYHTSDTVPCTIHIVKDGNNKNAIDIEGKQFLYYENDSTIHGQGPDGGWFTPSAAHFGMHLWISSGGLGTGTSFNYSVTKD